jgi:hypothetical protein
LVQKVSRRSARLLVTEAAPGVQGRLAVGDRALVGGWGGRVGAAARAVQGDPRQPDGRQHQQRDQQPGAPGCPLPGGPQPLALAAVQVVEVVGHGGNLA